MNALSSIQLTSLWLSPRHFQVKYLPENAEIKHMIGKDRRTADLKGLFHKSKSIKKQEDGHGQKLFERCVL